MIPVAEREGGIEKSLQKSPIPGESFCGQLERFRNAEIRHISWFAER